jgi:Xaa-Pro aminopeptidase
MDAGGIDLLVVPTEADSRYLTQMDHNIGPAIVPLVGEVTAISGEGPVGSAAHQWVNDLRVVRRGWVEGIIERLAELQANAKIVGLVGLDGSPGRPDGDLNYATFIALREVFPRTRWVGATALMQQVRQVKSAEEIQALARAAAASDAGIRACAEGLARGVTDRELRGQAVLAMLRAGGDHPRSGRLEIGGMNSPLRSYSGPIGRIAGPGDALWVEVNGRFQGYEAHGAHVAALGPMPPDWRDAWAVLREGWERAWQVLRPGVAGAQVLQAARAAATAEFGVRSGILGQGLGDDPPTVMDPEADSPTLEEGMCFTLKPYVGWSRAGHYREITWADTVVITRQGARRLGLREPARS